MAYYHDRPRTRVLPHEATPKVKILLSLVGAIYIIGFVTDWANWVAIGLEAARPTLNPFASSSDYGWAILAVAFGWFPAIFWPIHALGALIENAPSTCSVGALLYTFGVH